MKIKLLVLVLALIVCAFANAQNVAVTLSGSNSVSFSWNANAPTGVSGTTATGYKLHIGSSSGNYTQVFDAGNATTLTITTLSNGTWFAVVKAYNSLGTESGASNEVSFTLLAPTPTPTVSPTPSPTSSPSPSPTATPGMFAIGQSVVAIALPGDEPIDTTITVRSIAAGAVVGTQNVGTVGKINAGPQTAAANPSILNGMVTPWWNVTFPNGVSGWVGQVVLAPFSVPTPTPTVTPSPTPTLVKFGQTSILPTLDNNNAGLILAQWTPLHVTGTLQTLSFFVKTSAGTLRLGLYADNHGIPGSLLASTPMFTPKVGWNTVNVINPVKLAPASYWLAYAPSSNGLWFVKKAIVGKVNIRANFIYGPLPAVFPRITLTNSAQWSFYGTLSTP